MVAQILDGKALAQKERERLRLLIDNMRAEGARAPGLAVVLVGDDPASAVYVRAKTLAASECGVRAQDFRLPGTTSERALLELVARLNQDDSVDGILVQLPLPAHIDETNVICAIAPHKDVDGFHPENVGKLSLGTPRFVPCTPRGCMRLLEEAKVSLLGARALVVGRSNIVGKPMAMLLLAEHTTVTLAHSRTKNLADEVARADVVVAAVGRPELIRGAWIKAGAIVIDVGMNRGEGKKLLGDVEFASAKERAGAITPVPGGVGPMTIAMLLANTVDSARRRQGLAV